MYFLVIFILLFENLNCARNVGAKSAVKRRAPAKMLRSGDESLGPHLDNYFNSDRVQLFDKAWVEYQIPLQSYITNILQDGYTRHVLPKEVDTKLSSGFLVSDTTVDVLFEEMRLRELPYISSTVNLFLPFNYLDIVGHTMNKIFIDTKYILFRNGHDILFGKGKADPADFSPFTLHQVQEKGPATIIAEDCKVNGTAVVALNGPSVALRHSRFSLEDCAFSIEISSPGQGLPPVIAPYFIDTKRRELMRLINKPLRDALNARLETILYSNIVNEQLYSQVNETNFNHHQQKIFKMTSDFLSAVVIQNLKKISIKKNKGTLKLPDSEDILVTREVKGKEEDYGIKVHDVILQGVDSVYDLPNAGGPYKIDHPMISDSIIFKNVVVRGTMSLVKGTDLGKLIFKAELKDVAADVTFSFYDDDDSKVHVRGWRNMDYTIYDLKSIESERDTANAMLHGYLSREVPAALENYLKESLSEILEDETKQADTHICVTTPKQDEITGFRINAKEAEKVQEVTVVEVNVVNDTTTTTDKVVDDIKEVSDQQTSINLKISINGTDIEPPKITTKRSSFWSEVVRQIKKQRKANHQFGNISSISIHNLGSAKNQLAPIERSHDNNLKVVEETAVGSRKVPHRSDKDRAKVLKKKKKSKKYKHSKKGVKDLNQNNKKKVRFDLSGKKSTHNNSNLRHDKGRFWYNIQDGIGSRNFSVDVKQTSSEYLE